MDQTDFLNGAVLVETNFGLDEFKNCLKQIEIEVGRDKSRSKYAPREIDIDVVVWNNKAVHPDYTGREFVRRLAREVLPGLDKK